MEIVAHIENDFKEKFGIPRQSGIVDEVESRIVFEEKYRNPDAVRGLEQFSHLWLIWLFSEGFASQDGNEREWSPTVRPPRLGGNERIGVWASRSPNRPNPIGLSCVEIVKVESDTPSGPVITVKGADLMDRTPIIDIKPYIVYADSKPNAASGYAQAAPEPTLTVTGLDKLPPDIDPTAVEALLSHDPRPAYKNTKDDSHAYYIKYGNYDISFSVNNSTVCIINAAHI